MRALITASFDPAAKARLERHMEVVHEDWKERHSIWFDGAAFAKHIADVGADVLVIEADLVHAEVLDAVPIKMIGCCRGEPVNVDLELATRLGIPVFHTPGRNADAVADLTLAFMLMLARHLPAIEATYRGEASKIEQASDYLKMYTRFTGVELGSRTVGLVGLGAVGREVAARVAPFKARVLAYDPYVKTPPPGVTMSALEPLLRESDFVSLHAPVTPETQGLLSAERLALLKPTAFVINTARAALTDENALYELLRAGTIAGAALDVLAEEPLQPGNRFLALSNVVVTPHIGGATLDVTRHQSDIIVDAIEAHLRGERPHWIANPAVLDGKA
ncbi:MAG TPA: NAD(P)-dependent oxidoreductase [Candidatus Binatia bacterium]|jgi:autoinducer 2 (AI-2) kinase|nr:NAD(P)-dependent oxidoreductase [Candidatus Binatia bacterium]